MDVKIATLTLCYNEEASIKEVLDALVGYSDEIVVVEGGWSFLTDKGYPKRSTDKTIEIIEQFEKDHDNVTIEYANGKDSTEQYNIGLKIAKEKGVDYLHVIDSDEYYDESLLRVIRKTLEQTMGNVYQYRVHSYNFLNSFDKWYAGCYPRIFKITPECSFKIENRMVWPDKGKTEDQGQNPPPSHVKEINPMFKFYHMTWNRKPEKIQEKYNFMWASCDGNPNPELKKQYYVDEQGNCHVPSDLQVYDFKGKLPKEIEAIKDKFK